MKSLFLFFKDHLGNLLLLFFCILECFIVFFLYDLPLLCVLYAALLCSVTLFIGTVFFFVKTVKKHAALRQCCKQKVFEISLLPKPTMQTEVLYQEFIKILLQELAQEQNHAKAESEKTASYYTLWNHQIKTPIAAIRLLLQEESVQKGALEQELLKIEQYVQMALSYQRLDSKTKDLKIASYQLDNMVRYVIKKIAPLFIYKKIHLSLDDISCSVITDEKWTVFLIEQLLTNAVKYTPKEGSISIFLDHRKPACLVIKDTGIGILPEDLPRIFEWGYTGYNGRMKKNSTGIGLALCQNAAKMLGHTISIESKPQIGTTVYLDLSNYPLKSE